MYQSVTEKLFKPISLVAYVAVLTACSTYPATVTAARDIPIVISFDAAGCPTSANANLSNSAKPGDKLVFTSSPADQQYSLTFGPFVGKPYNSDSNGTIKTLPLNGKSFATQLQQAEFKYSIYADGCQMIDPKVIIDR